MTITTESIDHDRVYWADTVEHYRQGVENAIKVMFARLVGSLAVDVVCAAFMSHDQFSRVFANLTGVHLADYRRRSSADSCWTISLEFEAPIRPQSWLPPRLVVASSLAIATLHLNRGQIERKRRSVQYAQRVYCELTDRHTPNRK